MRRKKRMVCAPPPRSFRRSRHAEGREKKRGRRTPTTVCGSLLPPNSGSTSVCQRSEKRGGEGGGGRERESCAPSSPIPFINGCNSRAVLCYSLTRAHQRHGGEGGRGEGERKRRKGKVLAACAVVLFLSSCRLPLAVLRLSAISALSRGAHAWEKEKRGKEKRKEKGGAAAILELLAPATRRGSGTKC